MAESGAAAVESESRLRWRDNSMLPFLRLESGVLVVLPMPNSSGGSSLRPLAALLLIGDVSDEQAPPTPLAPLNLSDRLVLPTLKDNVLESLERPESCDLPWRLYQLLWLPLRVLRCC